MDEQNYHCVIDFHPYTKNLPKNVHNVKCVESSFDLSLGMLLVVSNYIYTYSALR